MDGIEIPIVFKNYLTTDGFLYLSFSVLASSTFFLKSFQFLFVQSLARWCTFSCAIIQMLEVRSEKKKKERKDRKYINVTTRINPKAMRFRIDTHCIKLSPTINFPRNTVHGWKEAICKCIEATTPHLRSLTRDDMRSYP